MKTFKKLFAYSAIFALLATMMPTYANAASYSEELTEAYGYAKNKWITTMASIDDADMYGNLTRVAMAKMVANYVLDLGLQELDTTKECKFPDVSEALDAAYDNGVTKACQLGLMGVGIEKFNPNGIVTRAEFGTVLSRALWGDEYNDATPYYKAHLEALKAEGIMTKIDNPNMKEVRGYVMLMMMRADDNYSPATGCSAEELLACILAEDHQACIATCADEAEEVLPGYVSISKVNVPAQQDVPRNAVNVKIGTIKLTAGENGARVSSLEVSRDGLANMDTTPDNRPQIYVQGGNVKTTAKSVSSNTNKAIVKFSPALDLKAGSSMEFDVMMSMDPAADAVNSTHNFKVTAVNVANGTASGTPLNLGTVKTTSAVTKNVTFNIKNGDTTAKAGENKALAKVEVIFDNAWTLKGFTLDAATTPVENLYDVFANAKAYVDGAVVGNVNLSKDKIIVSGLDIAKAKDAKVTIEIKADVVYSKANVDVVSSYDNVDVLEGNSGFGMSANDAGTATITVQGSDISFKKLAIEKNVLPGTSQVRLFAGEIKTATDIVVQKVEITPTLTTSGNFAKLYSNGSAVFKINGEEFEITDTNITDGVLFSIPNMEVGVDAGTTAKVEIIVNTKVPTPLVGATVSFTVELKIVENAEDSAITYVIPPRAGDTVKIAAGDIKLSKATIAWPATESLFANAEQEVGRFAIKANNDTVVLRDFNLDNNWGTLTDDDFLALFDGNLTLFKIDADNETEVSANITFNDSTKNFEVRNMNVEIAKDKTVNFKLMANLGNIKDYYGSGVLFNITANSVRATSSVEDLTNAAAQDLSTNPYTFRVTRPTITLTKNSENMFKVVIKNVDDDVDIHVENLKFRVRSLAADSDFDGVVCLTDDVNQIDCAWANNFWKWLTGLTLTTINNNDELLRYILVDGANIEPEVLQAQIASLDYNKSGEGTFTEKYNVVVR